jgi:hypothetical protein
MTGDDFTGYMNGEQARCGGQSPDESRLAALSAFSELFPP